MKSARILMIEDEALVARDIEVQLTEMGYLVVGITDMAEDAVPLAREHKPDLILMDVHLAGAMDGIEAATAVRRELGIPVIFLTAFAGDDTLARAKLSDPFGYIIKPFDDRYLKTVIEMALYKHQAEAHLRRAYDEQATILRTALDGFFMADWQGRLLDVNESSCRMLGYTRDELLKMSLTDLGVAHARESSATIEDFKQPETARFEGPQRRKDGQTIYVEMSVNYLPHSGGRIFCFARDVTDRRAAQESLERLNDELEARVRARTEDLDAARKEAESANDAKASFLATMTHELRTPLNGVIGTVEAMKQTKLEREQVEMTDLISESATSLLGIVDDILDFSKIEAGRLGIEVLPISLEEVVEQAAAVLGPVADRIGAELTLFTDPALPVPVMGDAGRLKQILLNLTNNAIKFSGKQERRSRVSLRATLKSRQGRDAIVEFEIKDNGIGMSSETISGLFNSFTQADSSISRLFGGTGLGLAISKNLAELMGGQIKVESKQGQGSTFTLTLPMIVAGESQETEPAINVLAGLSCLIVAPPGGLQSDLEAYLEAVGAAVDHVPDLPSARLRAEHQQKGPSIWIFDIAGEAPSLDVLKATAREKPTQDIRFVLVGRGRRRHPRPIAENVVVIDANVLRRETFLQAVATAAGKATAWEEPLGTTTRKANPVPSRAEAVKNGQLILVAEDSEINQKVIRRQLMLLGYAADIAPGGREALEMWRSGEYGLLLADLHMPEMDGYQLTAAIRVQEPPSQHSVIIALTADILRGGAQQCRDVGLDDYLSKPARLSDLKAMLEKWMPSSEGPTTPAVAISDLKQIIGSDPSVMRDFLWAFQEKATETATKLLGAYEQKDALMVAELAGQLKSPARSIGAEKLAKICGTIEEAGKTSDFAALSKALPEFNRERESVAAYIAQS